MVHSNKISVLSLQDSGRGNAPGVILVISFLNPAGIFIKRKTQGACHENPQNPNPGWKFTVNRSAI